jgi:hypothetical protein
MADPAWKCEEKDGEMMCRKGKGDMVVVTKQVLDLEEWDLVLAKLHRYHANIQQECGIIVQTIRKEMKSELVPLAEEKATHGKVVKKQIRDLWALEYEIEEIQTEFAKGIGSINIEELTDDFVEDVMLQSKPLQGILMAIRLRQRDACEGAKAKYGEAIKDLEPLKLVRPPKPAPAPAAPAPEAPKAEAPAAAPAVEAAA